MLIKPSIDYLLEKVESKYALVVLAARRGRQLREIQGESQPEVKTPTKEGRLNIKEVSQALREIGEDKITYTMEPVGEQLADAEVSDTELVDEDTDFATLSKELDPEGMA